MTKLNDPHAAREAEKYENPIPSREYILELLTQLQQPLSYDELVAKLKLTEPDALEALRRRLKAMQRDGQLMQNRRGAYALVERMNLIPGRVSAHKDGFGFLIPDAGGDDLFLSARQMRAVFHGDRVLASVIGKDQRGRLEGNIVEILERNTEFVVGQYRRDNGIGWVESGNKKVLQDILVPADKTLDAVDGDIVNVKIISQPTAHRQAVGEIIEIVGKYMAPGMEIEVAIRGHGLPHEWPPEVIKESEHYHEKIPLAAYKDREDIRDLALVTIDGEDAKDFDDAVYCEPRKGGGWRLIVAIADVSYYVSENSALDKVAFERGNSVYFPGRVIPMLPEVLSNGLCSLNPNVDRLCMVCDMQVSKAGKVSEFRFYPAVMHSKARMTYTNVAKILLGDKKLRKQYAAITPQLDNLNTLYQAFAVQRQKRGALDFDSVETKIVFGRNKKIENIVPVERNEAHRLIEEMMLAANVCAAEFLHAAKVPIVYRNHAGPPEEKLVDLRQFLASFSLTLNGGKTPKPADYAHLLQSIHARPDHYLIQTVLLRSMSQAVYSPENIGHFGLAYAAYTHFTSPIRRYPDLLVHRAIKAVLGKHNWPHTANQMQQSGEHCSHTERRADEATRDVNDWLKCEYMQNKVGQSFNGMITSVKNFGIFVLLDNVYVEGLVHITALKSDYYDYDAVHHVLRGQRAGQTYRLGDKIQVRITRVDLDKRQIDFELSGGKK